jgi:hypothetical protein
MEILISIILIPVIIFGLIGVWNWWVNGLANNLSSFIYYSVHKHDDEN